MRRLVLIATCLVAAIVAGYFLVRERASVDGTSGRISGDLHRDGVSIRPRQAPVPPDAATASSGAANRPLISAAAGSNLPSLAADFPIAAPLGAENSTINRDLAIVQQLFEAWQSNFPQEGNPVGENAEITAALMGANRLGLALIPKDHRALNEKGELCDRWGVPFRFHQISGSKMEVRSAGPDRKFATDDDAVWSPP